MIKLFGKNASIRSPDLAYAMFIVGLEGHGQEILENMDILKISEKGRRSDTPRSCRTQS